MPPRPASRPGPPPRPSALAAPVCPCCTRLLLLLPASQGSTGDPRLLSRRKAIASQAPPSRGWHVASCRPAPPPILALPLLHASALVAPGEPGQHSLLPVCPCCTRLLLLLPASQGSTGDPRLLSRRKAIASQAPPSRGWHVASCRPVPPRAFAIHQNGTFGERLLPHLGNLPGKGSFFRKVRRFSGGPSMPGAVFPEGPAFFRGTFHARGRFPGRPCVFQGDLPC